MRWGLGRGRTVGTNGRAARLAVVAMAPVLPWAGVASAASCLDAVADVARREFYEICYGVRIKGAHSG